MVGFGDQAVGVEGALVFKAVGSPSALLEREEGGSIGEIVEEEEGRKGYDDG
jgi:hypothetical protein